MRKNPNYWSIKENFYREMKQAIKKNNGEFPSQLFLNKNGFSSLPSAARYYGGLNTVRINMGYELNRKPAGHWVNWDNVKAKLEEIIEECGEFPSQRKLYKMNYSGLSTAIIEYHGGFMKVREKMGHKLLSKPAGYWMVWNNVEKETKRIIKRNNGKFPSHKYLIKNNLSGILNGFKNFGGSLAIRKKMGYEYKRYRGINSTKIKLGGEFNVRTPGYYKDWSIFYRDMKKVIKENNREFPTQVKLSEINRGDLMHGAAKYHGGLLAVKEKMGYSMPLLDLKEWKNVKAEIEEIIKKNNGKFPTHEYLVEINYSRLSNAIRCHHGGFNAVREKIGYEIERRSNGHWRNWETVKKGLEKIIKMNNGEFPNRKFLKKIGFTGLGAAIDKYYGGVTAVRKKMGYEPVRRASGYYKDWDVFESELLQAIKLNNGKFPTQKDLKRICFYRLVSGIKYHGGMNYVKERMGYEPNKKPHKYWQKEENIEYGLKKAIKLNNGEFPNQKFLCEIGLSSLSAAIIKYHRGFNAIRKKMGYELSRKPNGYYKNWDDFKLELEKVIKLNNGNFPTQEFLKKIKLTSLYHYFDCYGGVNAVREKMGYELIERPKKYWQDWSNTKKELNEFIEENNDEFPNAKILIQLKKSSLSHAITLYHGGFPAVREKIGYNELMRKELARDLEEIAERLVG